MIEYLLTIENIDVNKADQDGVTSIFMAAQNNHPEVQNLSIQISYFQIKTNKKLENRFPSIFLILIFKVVKLLVNHPGIDVNTVYQSAGTTPLMMAAKNGHQEVTNKLSKYCDKNNQNSTILNLFAARDFHFDTNLAF